MTTRWSKEKVISEIRRLARTGPLWFRRLRRDNRPLLSAADYYFGSWRAALKAAGVAICWKTSNPGPVTISEARVLEILKVAWSRRDIRINPLRAKYPGIYKAARRYFGTWPKALRAAGVPAWAYATRMSAYRIAQQAS